MKELQRKQKIRQIIYSFPALIILTIITFFLVKGAIKVMDKEWESSKRVKDLEGKVATLILREQKLREGIGRLETEEGIKEEIKERFNVTAEGEHVAVIVDRKEVSSSTDLSALPWYKRFWIAIMGNK